MPQTITCATCPLSRQIEGNRFECTSAHKSRVVRAHWAATTDCDDAIENHQIELQQALITADEEFANGQLAGLHDAQYKTTTKTGIESNEWLEGYHKGFADYLESLFAETKIAPANTCTYKEWQEAVALLPAGIRVSGGYFYDRFGGCSNLPPVELTQRQLKIVTGVIKVF